MKPIRLELQGFTSFRDKAVIDFSGLDLFAITGPTGAGKTSLIDALVYALYGMTPRAGGNVGELISQGAKRGEVLLEFQAGAKRYRIARTVRRGRTSVQSNRRLEERRADGEWEPLTDLERETRKEIHKIIGLDFNGFTKSVVLPQGEFDRFLKGDPADRRRILTDLLQLRVYEEMGRRARDRAKDASARASTLKGQLESSFADANPKQRNSLKKELAEAKRSKKRLDKELAAVETALPTAREIRRKRIERDQARSDLQSVERRLEKSRRIHRELSERLQTQRATFAELGERIERVGYDPGRHLSLSALQPKADRLAKLDRELQSHQKLRRDLKKRLAALQASIDRVHKKKAESERRSLEAEKALLEAESSRNEAVTRHGPLEEIRMLISELPQRRERLERISDLASRLELHGRERKAIQRRIEELESRAQSAARSLDRARRELSQLRMQHSAEDLRTRLRPGKPCPVCLQTVAQPPPRHPHPKLASAEEAARRSEAESEDIKGELAQCVARFEAMPAQCKLLEEGLDDAREQALALDRRIGEILGQAAKPDPTPQLKKLQKRLEALDALVQSRRKALDEAAKADRALAANTAQALHELSLAKRDDEAAAELQRKDSAELAQLREELADWPDPGALQERLRELEKSHNEKQRLEKLRDKARIDMESTVRRFQEAEKETHLMEADRERHGKVVSESQSALKGLEASLAGEFPDCRSDGKGDEADRLLSLRAELERRRSKTADQIARGEEKLAHLTERIQQADRMRTQAKALESKAAVAYELGLVLSAGRFITFIQEEALSRLGDGATRHLRSLSSDRYSFSVEQGSFFVLDHWNADEARPVTTLSGGESFLASLSLALSLAESLAEFCTDRERFSLESLFLDEGFSTLDPETLEIVVQGIEALAAGDRMIGAVSHIPELAERFPNRIQVRKSVGGSTVVVE